MCLSLCPTRPEADRERCGKSQSAWYQMEIIHSSDDDMVYVCQDNSIDWSQHAIDFEDTPLRCRRSPLVNEADVKATRQIVVRITTPCTRTSYSGSSTLYHNITPWPSY